MFEKGDSPDSKNEWLLLSASFTAKFKANRVSIISSKKRY